MNQSLCSPHGFAGFKVWVLLAPIGDKRLQQPALETADALG